MSLDYLKSVKFQWNKPCVKDCFSCGEVTGCVNKRAIWKPLPGWLWGVLGVGITVPLALTLTPDYFYELYAGKENIIGKTSREREEHYGEIMKKVGVEDPQKVKIIETTNVGPTTIGTTKRGFIFVPKVLFDLAEQPVDEEERDRLLKTEGTIIPTQEEVDFIIGHEAAHLVNHHSFFTAANIVTGFAASHLLIKSYNNLMFYLGMKKKQLTGALKTTAVHTMMTMGFVATGLFFYSWHIEKEADLDSASHLGLAHQAKVLAEKKQQQNLTNKALYGDPWITSKGNDLTHLEHPPVTYQIQYLQKLEKGTPSYMMLEPSAYEKHIFFEANSVVY